MVNGKPPPREIIIIFKLFEINTDIIIYECRRPQFNSWVRKSHWKRDIPPTPVFLGFPCDSAGKESTCNAEDLSSIPGLGRFPWRREKLPIPVFWPGEFHKLYGPWGGQESDMTERLSLLLCVCVCASVLNCFSRVGLLATPWTIAHSSVRGILQATILCRVPNVAAPRRWVLLLPPLYKCKN